MTKTIALGQPTALIVEDEPSSLETRKRMLESSGFTVFGASDLRTALSEVRAVPSIDIVVTDINLNRAVLKDKSGVTLARSIRADNATLPIIGYSALFTDGELGSDDLNVFDDYLPKGSVKAHHLDERINAWKERALSHREQRMSWSHTELQRLRDKYGAPESNFATLRRLDPENNQEGKSEGRSAEEVLKTIGYRLRILEPGTSRPRLHTSGRNIISPLAVWVRQEDDISVAEVYGYSELYAYADNEEEALAEILVLMEGFYKELVQDLPPDDSLSILTLRLRDFLKHVFG
jgi:CheY-like chemotaxis protein/uncharacterized protein YqiB (DUF1249 family)